MSKAPADDFFLLLAHQDRRRVLEGLLGQPSKGIDAAAFFETETVDITSEAAEFYRHVNLLQEADVIRYDADEKTITQGPCFDRIAPLVRAISRARTLDSAPMDRDPFDLIGQALQEHLLDCLADLQAAVDRLDGEEYGDGNEDAADPADVKRHVDDLRRRVETVQAFVRTLTGTDSYRQKPVVLRSLLQRQISDVQRVHDGLDVDVDSIPDVMVKGDERLPLVFQSLLEHATEPAVGTDTSVTVTGRHGDGEITVVVVADEPDTTVAESGGPTAMERADSRTGAEFPLRFSERILDAHDGTLQVANQAPVGTEYRVSLPCLDRR